MAHRRSDYVPLGYSAAIPFYPAENNPHEKLRLFCGHHHQHYPDDPSNRNRAAYSRQSSVENGNKCTSLDRISYLSEDRIQDDSLIKYSRQLTADSCHRNRIHRPSRHERSPSVDQNSGDSHLYPIEREHPYPDPTPFPSGESVRERNHANQNGFARVAIWPCDRSSIGSNSCGGRGLQRQSSGSSFADSLPSSDLPLPTFSPSISLSGSDSAFINALYDEGWRHNKQMLNTQFEDPSKNWARQTEESYNLQLAFALRLTAEASLTEGLDLLGSDCKETDVESGSFLRSSAEGIALRFWVNGSLSYHDKVQDGFYYIWGMNPYVWTMCNDLDEGGRMPSLESLRAVDASYSSMEVVLVDKRGDSHLRELENKALSLAYGCTSTKEVVEHLGKLVCMLMGGAASTEHGDLTTRWKVSCKMLRDCLNSIVLPIGSLSVGLCRHRSLLFKVLADTIDLPCRIARGCKYCGLDGGSSSLVQLGDEREYFVDLIGKPGSLCHPDSFVNGPLSLSIASPLHFPDFKSSQVTDEVRYLAQWYASDSRYLERMFDKTDSKLNVAAAGQIDDSSKESRIAHSDSAVVSSAVSSAHATTKPFFRSSVASPRVDDVSMQKVAVQHLMEKQVLKTLNEDKVANNCGIVSDIDLTTDSTITLGGERAQLQKGHFRKDSENNNCEIMCVSTKGNANGEECLRQSPFQTHEHRNVQVESNERESLQHRLLQIHKQRDVQNHASDEECPQQRLMQTQKHKDAQTKLDRSKDGRVEDGSALMTKAHVEISLAIDGLEIPWEDLVLKERIGAGSFGTVHHADWHGSDVAVKILIDQDLNEERLKEFLREVAIMKRLRHPNVVLFMGAVTMRPNLSIVTEYLPRGSLYRLIHRAGARELLDERRRLRMALDVAKGMNYLHWLSPPIVHRDLKSPNLLVDKTWTVKVCDFGLSQLKANTFLSSKSAAGTPEWMAPEVLRDEPSNEKSDIYSFGVILWELVTMQQPWNGLSPAQVVGAVGFQNRRLQIPKDMNPDIATIIESCWASDSKQRPTFASIMESLKPLVKSPGIQSIQSGMLQHA